jgi:flagellar assembly protein FliH
MSTILKAGSSGKVLRRLDTVDLADHLREARGIIEAAQRRAEAHFRRIQEEAKDAAEQLRQDAREDGFRAGVEQGVQAGQEQGLEEARRRFEDEHARLVADLKRMVADFEGMKEELRLAAQRDLLGFSVMLARKLTFAVGELHHEAVVENVRRAVETVGKFTDLTICVNPADAAAMERFCADLRVQIARGNSVRLAVDESIAAGGCVVRSERTEVDARLETQAEEIAALLLGERRRD